MDTHTDAAADSRANPEDLAKTGLYERFPLKRGKEAKTALLGRLRIRCGRPGGAFPVRGGSPLRPLTQPPSIAYDCG